ncbi:gamma-glutamyltransferase [Reichenbachiella ulvae]|uniref:Glutathione hydrolase proenzyme n=1 Tax=Reichenbachiella ulvae TaxID=2980104 RepID=A0ABT3CVP9_9BACT|nr:gamma-glutamyltransferase [Reichenbachiella ulvae]MCV9387777.1 gamma-glutamyltransferase [Reichenbachiella ulvae]
MKQFYLLTFTFLFSIQLWAQDRIASNSTASRSEVLAKNGMVATSHPLATQIGLDILKSGGNAIDAAIAANAALGLMEPTGSGIGGDLFAIIWSAKDQKLYGLNASGRSSQNISLDYFKERGMDKIPAFGPLPVTVPGCVDGWFEMHKKFGSKSMKEILFPAIKYAREGVPVPELIGFYLNLSAKRFKDYPNFADTYMPNGEPLKKGDVFANPYLADTYEKLAKKGRDGFYKGEMAQIMADFLQEQGGVMSVEDFAAHSSEWVEPVSTNYRGYDVWELPPNGQGIAALQILNIMEGYDVAAMGFGSGEYMHHFVEAKKLAFEDRAKYYADMNFVDVPVEELISKEYAAERRKLINERAARTYDAGKLEQGNTIYMTTADKDGNMVSLIQSNYRGMGSGMVPPKLGFMFQDRGELFSLEEGHSNVIEPGKRPFHTIIPSFITKDGKPWISFGLMGGAMQPQGHAQIVINLIDFGMNLQEAGDAPRIHHTGSTEPTGGKMTDGGEVNLESGFEYDEIKKLLLRRHKISYSLGVYGGYQAIMYDAEKGIYYGASESRKDGQAAGY